MNRAFPRFDEASYDHPLQKLTLSQLLGPDELGKPAFLYLHPDDQLSEPVESIPVSTQNVLLKVTVPRRTGRKRKRDSSEPFSGNPDDRENSGGSVRVKRIDCGQLRRTLRDNVGKFQVEVVGSVSLTHRWRGMSFHIPILLHRICYIRCSSL